MHCVSIYPTPPEKCNLSTITEFKSRYRGITIGWSTHEDQDALLPVAIAKCLGAEMFERHIGVETDTIKLNSYSSTPKQTEQWLNAFCETIAFLGEPNRETITDEELAALNGLKRGVFARKNIDAGVEVSSDDVYFAFPYREGQISSGEFCGGVTTQKIFKDTPITNTSLSVEVDKQQKLVNIIKHAIHSAKVLLAKANVALNHQFETEYSHHYGIERFFEIGTTLITVVNREYAKKILVQLKGQSHPLHMHKLKEETFLVLHGVLDIELDGAKHTLRPGEQITVLPGAWHQFSTETGCVFEEISTTAYKSDSYYRDKEISKMTSEERKTKVDHWGRFVIDKQILDC